MGLSAVKDFANSTIAKVALAGAITLSVFSANAQSLPFESGKCYDQIAVKAALSADNQKPIFVGDRITDRSPTNIFYMNNNGYGYNTELKKASKPTEKDELCVGASFNQIQLNYLDNPEIPLWAKGIKPNRGIDIQKAYKNQGDDVVRLAMVAYSYRKDANGKEIKGNAIVVAVMPNVKEAAIWSVNPYGIPDGTFSMRNFGVHTGNFNQFMSRGFGSLTR